MKKEECRRIAEEMINVLEERGLVKDEIIGVNEVAAMLGVTPKTVRNNIKDIPHSKYGGRLRFFRSSIYKMLKNG